MDASDSRLQELAAKCAELEKEAARYRAIVEDTSELIGVTTFAPNPVYTYISPSHKGVFGYEPAELVGKAGADFIHPDDLVRLLPLMGKYLESQTRKLLTGKRVDLTERINFRFRDKQGSYHYMESTVNLMQDEILFVSRDVTERKQAEARFQEKVKELEDFHKLAVGRELKMIELEDRIEKLQAQLAKK
ncbi:MAG: PAS domain S-box protein [Candidatus Margulisiibacteriota bacterium]